MKILVAGDFCDHNRVSKYIKMKEYSILFSSIKDIITDADYSFVNLEFPIVSSKGKPITKCGPNLKGQLSSIDAIKWAGFNCCTLANNHILDQGEKCLLETCTHLQYSGINIVGAGENLDKASRILYLEKDGKTLAVINCCEHEFSIATEQSAGANPLNPIQQFYKIQEARRTADYVLIIVHGGHEHYQLPSLRMKETYRFYIDAGADAVVNHHQHCFSGYERYKGKPIFYGIGNFLFDNIYYNNKTWNEGFLVTLDFNSESPNFELYPYTQCSESVTITLMDKGKREDFFQELNNLNEIIADNTKLQVEFERRVKEISRNYTYLFQPMRGRIVSSLFSRGFISSMVGKKMKQKIINYICCESHRDCLLSSLKKL